MKAESIKPMLLELLKAAEKTIEADLRNDANEDAKKNIKYLLHFFKFIGIDMIEKLALQGKAYVHNQVQLGIQKSTKLVAKLISSLITLIITFLTICVGLIFGAIAFSLWIGTYVGSAALGFLISGALWILLVFIVTKMVFNKKRLEKMMLKKMHLENNV